MTSSGSKTHTAAKAPRRPSRGSRADWLKAVLKRAQTSRRGGAPRAGRAAAPRALGTNIDRVVIRSAQMTELMVGVAATRSGWSARMLRYLEQQALVVPRRTQAGYRTYGLGELNQLRALRELRRRFGVELSEIAFAARL